ncbi:MAG: 16S rRNA (cytidine(1402)-2'-O)-methyltransferase [Armatimonadetes bacterium RBG_16_58_9]|nr:MAG: 16S rRNA (cytidine(1402)-2'-O)-methyltransferase [Armatimonadetes bacterium RBG_16_58_9]
MAGKLYIVSTPIGNLEDITLRALRILREADIIAAEDTRVTRKLLSHYDIHTPMIAYHQHSKGRRAEEIVGMVCEGKNVALVSDAGTPGISDPGHELIALCIAEGIKIEAIPGPTALITALVVSGLPTSHFAFDGFPPRRETDRRAFFKVLKRNARTVCLYESPSRLVKTLESIRNELGDRNVAIIREATKLFEEVFRGTVGQAIDRFSRGKVRGEVVIVLGGASPEQLAEAEVPSVSLESRLSELVESGMSERDAVRQCMVEFKLPKRRVYAAALALKQR